MPVYKTISIIETTQLLREKNPLVLDIRDELSFQQGHLAEAKHLNDARLKQLIKSGQKALPVLIYCYHGNSSKDIAQMFCDFGFQEVYSMDGGYTAWSLCQG